MKNFLNRLSLFIAFCMTGCVSAPPMLQDSPVELYEQMCSIGSAVNKVMGTTWIKIRSKELTGQFSADVAAEAPSHLKLNILNSFGGELATMQVEKTHFFFQENGKSFRGGESWQGVPLTWIVALFLGKIPCPVVSSASDIRQQTSQELRVTIPAHAGPGSGTWTYRFHSEMGYAWPEAVEWVPYSSKGQDVAGSIHLRLKDPDPKSGSPHYWEVESSQGLMKVRWKERIQSETEPLEKNSIFK